VCFVCVQERGSREQKVRQETVTVKHWENTQIHTSPHCNTPHTVTHLQHTCNTPQYTAIQCNTLATHCNTLAIRNDPTLQTLTYPTKLPYKAYPTTLQTLPYPTHTATLGGCQNNKVHCNTLQHTATHLQHTCNTLQHITTNLRQPPSSTGKTHKYPFTPNLRRHTRKHALIHMATLAVWIFHMYLHMNFHMSCVYPYVFIRFTRKYPFTPNLRRHTRKHVLMHMVTLAVWMFHMYIHMYVNMSRVYLDIHVCHMYIHMYSYAGGMNKYSAVWIRICIQGGEDS